MKRDVRTKYVIAGQLLLGIPVGVIAAIVFVKFLGSPGGGYAIVLAIIFALIGGVIGDVIFKSKSAKD